MTDRQALERIMLLLKTHGGECPGTNYQLLCAIQKLVRQTLAQPTNGH
jgi:hypothetical protein